MDNRSDNTSLADFIRFSGDSLKQTSSGDDQLTQRAHGALAYDGLMISPNVTPGLFRSLEKVCDRLETDISRVSAFVRAAPQGQAECISFGSKRCVLRFSSALIELLSEKEFEFVCGHELGHFLLGHGLIRMETEAESAEFYLQQRAQEISVDRLGLIACRSTEHSLRAMIKSASGLSDEHLRFDTSKFIDQLNHLNEDNALARQIDTHPSFLVRARALLWFSMTGITKTGIENIDRKEIDKIDAKITQDLNKYVDGPTRRVIQEACDNFALWHFAYRVVTTGAFNKDNQKVFEERFGLDKLNSLKSYLGGLGKEEAEVEVYERMRDARAEFERTMPLSFNDSWNTIEKEISILFE